MHSGGLELTKPTYTRLEDDLMRHRGDWLHVYTTIPGFLICPEARFGLTSHTAYKTNKQAVVRAKPKLPRKKYPNKIRATRKRRTNERTNVRRIPVVESAQTGERGVLLKPSKTNVEKTKAISPFVSKTPTLRFVLHYCIAIRCGAWDSGPRSAFG